MSSDKRQPGYYRVKYNGKWAFGLYNVQGLNTWAIPNNKWYLGDMDFEEIDPTPIDPNPAPQLTGQQFTSKDEVYAAHQAIVDALGGHRGKELDLLVKLAYTAIAGIHEAMPQPTGQLTAEELLYRNVSDDAGTPRWNAEEIINAMEEYAAQQTAALREELNRIMELCGVQHVNGESGALVAVSYILKERRELAAWKKDQMDVTGPLFDFGQSKEAGLPLGGSIIDEAISALKERKALREELDIERYNHDHAKKVIDQQDARIKELEAHIDKLATQGICELSKMEKEKDARIAELEKECARWKYAHEDMTRNMEATHIASCEKEKELEAVKKERDELAWHNTRIITVENQRDEAVKLLGKATDLIEGDLHDFMTLKEQAICMDIRQGFERLSSGETKQPEIPDSSTCNHKWTVGKDDKPTCIHCGVRPI